MLRKLKTVLVALLLSNGIFAQDVNLPDNINLDPCFGEVPASEWKTPTCQTSPGNNYMALSSVRVGDVDGDGYPEIVTSNYGDQVYIVDGRTLNVKKQFTAESMYAEGVNAIAKIKWSDTEEKTVVYCFNTTGFLLLYSADGIGGRLYYSPQLYPSDGEGVIYSAFSNVVDLDGDGWSEIVVGNKVLAAENLNLLCTLGSNQGAVQSWGSYNDAYQSSVADIDGDGKQEVCIGNEIYRVTVSSRTNDGATPELVKHIDQPTGYPDDAAPRSLTSMPTATWMWSSQLQSEVQMTTPTFITCMSIRHIKMRLLPRPISRVIPFSAMFTSTAFLLSATLTEQSTRRRERNTRKSCS